MPKQTKKAKKVQPLKSKVTAAKTVNNPPKHPLRNCVAALGDMEKGTYTGRRVDFKKYAAVRFNPYLFASPHGNGQGCGATALSLVTGIDPAVIARKNGRSHYSDEFMVKFLRSENFRVIPLTQCNVTQDGVRIGPAHVLLVSQLFMRNEATWGLIFGGIFFHNFELSAIDSLSLLNKPLLSAYVLHHPRWSLDPAAKIHPKSKVLSKRKPRPPIQSAEHGLLPRTALNVT
jgi:hypothetical protein